MTPDSHDDDWRDALLALLGPPRPEMTPEEKLALEQREKRSREKWEIAKAIAKEEEEEMMRESKRKCQELYEQSGMAEIDKAHRERADELASQLRKRYVDFWTTPDGVFEGVAWDLLRWGHGYPRVGLGSS